MCGRTSVHVRIPLLNSGTGNIRGESGMVNRWRQIRKGKTRKGVLNI